MNEDIKPIKLSPEDVAFLEVRAIALRRVCEAYCVPAELVRLEPPKA